MWSMCERANYGDLMHAGIERTRKKCQKHVTKRSLALFFLPQSYENDVQVPVLFCTVCARQYAHYVLCIMTVLRGWVLLLVRLTTCITIYLYNNTRLTFHL